MTLLFRISLAIHQQFSDTKEPFWTTEEAHLLLQCFHPSALGDADLKVFGFLNSFLPSFLHMCHCAQLLHPSSQPELFLSLIEKMGLCERGADNFRSAFTRYLLKSGLIRDFTAKSFMILISSIFKHSVDSGDLSVLLNEYLTVNELVQTLNDFKSCENLTSPLLQIVTNCSIKVSFRKQLKELQAKEFYQICDVMTKVKSLPRVDEPTWHSEGIPVIRAVVLASAALGNENENSLSNRRALAELLSLSGLLDEQFTLNFMASVFQSNCQWLVKSVLDNFDSTLLQHIDASECCELAPAVTQLIRLSCEYYYKSPCLVASALREKSSNDHFRTVCLQCAVELLAEQPFTKASIEINSRDAIHSTELIRAILQSFHQRLLIASCSASEKDIILDYLEKNVSNILKKIEPIFVYKIFAICLEKLVSEVTCDPSAVFDLLPALLENQSLWIWMTSDWHQDVLSLAENLRQRIFSKVQCLLELSKMLFCDEQQDGLCLEEFNRFLFIMAKPDKARTLTNDSPGSCLYDTFDLLLLALFGRNYVSLQGSADRVKLLEANVHALKEQSNIVEDTLSFLAFVAHDEKKTNMHLPDFLEKQSVFSSLKEQFGKSVGSFRGDTLVFQIFGNIDLSHIIAVRSLTGSLVFKRVLIRCNLKLCSPEHQKSEVDFDKYVVCVPCHYLIDKLLPAALTAYKEIITSLETGAITISQAKLNLGIDDETIFNDDIERRAATSLGVSEGIFQLLFPVSWLTMEDYLKLDERCKSLYIPFDFRLFIADIVKFIVEQVSSGRKGIADDQPFIKDLTNSLLEAKIDTTVSLMLANQILSITYKIRRKINSLKEFYTLSSWNLFVLKNKIGNFHYSYQLECRHQLLQVASIKEIQDHLRRFGPAVSSQIERALASCSRISDTIVKCCSKKNSAPPDGTVCELQTRTLSKDRLVCFDALMEPYIDSVVGKSQFFWRIFASHAVSLALADSSAITSSRDVAEFIDQYCSLVTKWLKAVTENDSKKTLEANASEFNFVVKQMLSSPFAEKFSLKAGGGILMCRLSLFVQRRFAPENKSFWKPEEATLLLSFLQKPALKGVSSQALRFLDSSLPSFLCLCYCAKVLHPSNSANDFAKLVKDLGFVERGGDKFRTEFSTALLNSGLLRSISCSNFASTVSAVFNDAAVFTDAQKLIEEFITIKKDAVEILSSFDSCEIVSPSLKQFVHSFGASILYKKHLSDLQTECWQRFCDIMPKAKKLQCVDESVWHDEVLPVIRRAIIAPVSNSKFENDSSVPNREALCDLLNLRGLLDTKLAVDFLSIIFSSKTHWLIKFCLEKFAGTFLNSLLNAKDDCKMNIFCQFIRLSCDYFHKSVCSTIAPLVQDSSCDSFKALCKESAHLVLNEKPLTRSIIETNVEDGMAAGLSDIVFEVCLVKLRDNEGNEKQKEDILKFLQHPNSSFSKDNHSRSLCRLLGLSLDNFLSVQFRQRQPNVFELLPALLEKHFMWMWMTNHSDQATEDLAEDVRQRMFSKLKCVVDFARMLFGFEAGKALSLTELHEFVSIFDKLDKSRKLSRENFESNLFDYFDLLLEAFFVNFHRNSQTKVVVQIMQESEKKWIEQSAVVDQIFEFLSLISGSNSPLNLKLLDLDEKQTRYRSLQKQFNDAVSSVGRDDLVFQIFEIRSVRNLELMKSLVKSELFRRVFVRCNPSSGASRNSLETKNARATVQTTPVALMSVQCNYFLGKMMPEAFSAYKELLKSGLTFEEVLALFGFGCSTIYDLEAERNATAYAKLAAEDISRLFRDSWLTLDQFVALDKDNQRLYVAFEFRLFIADIVKYIVEQVSSGRKGIADDQPFIKDLTNSLLEAKIDTTVSLMLANQILSITYKIRRKINSLKEFYTLPSWNLFIPKEKVGTFHYSYQLECRHQLLQVASIKQIQDHMRRFGPAVSSQIERALNSSSRISDTIVKCCSKKNSAPPDGTVCELQTRTLSKDRLVCFDALMEPYIDSVVGKSQFFWRIFASHAVSLALADSSAITSSRDVAEFIDQCYCSLVTKWLKAVTENDSKNTLEANASEFNFVVKRILSSPFAEKFSAKAGGGILMCRLSLFVQRRFAPENKSFWKPEEATLLLSFLQKPALKGVSSQALRFLDSSLPSFLCLCYCAKVLHPSNSANDFAKLVKHLGFVERGGAKFRTEFSAALLNSGLLRSISCSNFASTVSAVFNDAEDFNDAHILLEEFITIKEDAVEILSSFDSCEIVSPALKQFIHRFGASILYKKHLSDLQTECWQRFCDIMPKAKKLQCVDESVWHDEVLPVIRRAIIASVSNSKFENDSSVPNRQALCDLLGVKGFLDPTLAVDFLSIIFSSKTHWLIKFCLDIFAGTFLNYLLNAKDDCKMNIFCQFIRLSCDYFHKSVCATIAPLVQDSSCDSFKALCKESAHLVLNEKPLTRSIIETNVEDGMAAGLSDIVFEVCLVKLRDNEGNEKQKEDILKFLQHPNSSFSKDNHSRSLCRLLGLSLDNFLSVQFRQRQPNVFELLPALLEKHFMWMWMTNHSDPATEALAEDVRQRMFSKLKCIVDFARMLFGFEAGKALSLTELHEFVSIFDKLDKSRKLSRENFESNLFDYFDLLLEAFFVNFHRNSQTKVVVKIMQENEKKWIEQSAVVDQIFEFLSLISGSNSPLNLKLLDLEEKQARYRSLQNQFNDAVSSVGTDDLVFQIFEIRNVRNLELMKSLVKSELFRRVFVRFNPSTGGSRNLFDTEVHQSAVQKRPGALISIQCNYVLDKMLPDACAAYKEFWIAVEEGSLQLEKIKVYISDESKIDLSLEHEILSNLAISSTVVAKLYSVQLHKMWRSRVEVLQFFLTEFFDLNAASTNSPENSYASADDTVSDDENTEKASGFCTEALTNHEDATALIEEFLSLCERTTLLSEYLEVFNDVSGAFGCVDSNVWEVLAIMYESRQETLPFLREQQSSDFQQLLDNTDDTIAQDLSLSVINSLISLQQALRSFLSSGPKVSVKEIEESVLLSLKYFVAADGEVNIQNEVGERQKAAKNLIDRIKECSSHINSIKTLHASMGSRGETSKILT